MDSLFGGAFFVTLFIGAVSLLRVAWYVGVAVGLFKIWQKVRHLPG